MEDQQDGNNHSNFFEMQEKLNDVIAKWQEHGVNYQKLRAENTELVRKNIDLNHQLETHNGEIEAYQTIAKLSTSKITTKAADLMKLIKNDLLPTIAMPIGHREQMADERTTTNTGLASTSAMAIELGKLASFLVLFLDAK